MRASTPAMKASDIWDRFQPSSELVDLEILFFVRSATLGTDLTDGGGAIAHNQNSTADYPSHTRFTSGNLVQDDVSSIYAYAGNKLSQYNKRPPGGIGDKMVFEARVQLEQTTLCQCAIGFEQNIAQPTNGNDHAMFYYSSGVDANWHTETCETGLAVENQDTGIAADTDFHIFKIEIELAVVRFYIDGVLVTTHVTMVPNDPNDAQQPVIALRTMQAAVKYLKYEYVAVWNE